jgi:hypothetical protein
MSAIAAAASSSGSLAIPTIVRQRSSFDTMVAKTAAIVREVCQTYFTLIFTPINFMVLSSRKKN